MGLLDFIFGNKKKEQEEKKRLEAEKQKEHEERVRMEQELQKRDQALEDMVKAQQQLQQQLADLQKTKSKAPPPPPPPQPAAQGSDPEEVERLRQEIANKDKELEKERKALEQEFRRKKKEMFDEKTLLQEKMDKIAHERNELENLIKAEADGDGANTAQILELKKELESKISEIDDHEKEIKKREEALEKGELKGFVSALDSEDEISEELLAREEELRKKEEELAKKEEEIAQLDAERKEKDHQRREEFTKALKKNTFETFVVGPSNRFPFEVCQAVAHAPADAYNPLYIYGGVGLGKTHLLSAIGNYILGQDPEAIVAYVSSETFTNELLKAMETNALEEFRERYRTIDVLAIDDIQFIGKQEITQEEFFHTFNTLYNNHKQIIISSDRPPKDIPTLEDRLRSRFEGGLITDIKPPDIGTRTLILRKKADKDGITLPNDVVTFLASNIKSNIRTLIGSLNKVTAYANLAHKDITVDLCKDVLADVLESEAKLQDVEAN